mgnify:CR=1 FL=1
MELRDIVKDTLSAPFPEQQGLKQFILNNVNFRKHILSAPFPEQQGLKLETRDSDVYDVILSAPFPEQQGLKLKQ